jgi:acyl-coenzyme A thioesterase PaaI-like protein
MTSPTSTYAAWRRLSGRPGGTRLFSAAAMARVPYFASVLPHVVRMEPGLAEARVPKWFMVYNHLHTVHAIASCNAAEVAMGMLMEATVPRSHRWIPKAYIDRAGAGEGHDLAAGAGSARAARFHADHRWL